MLSSWKTTLFGALSVLAGFLHAGGVTLGHFGSTDIISLIGALSAGAVGLLAKDHNVTNAPTPADAQTVSK